jgi:hypothetical protein
MRKRRAVCGLLRKGRESQGVEERVLAACRLAEAQAFRVVAHAQGLEVSEGVYAPVSPTAPWCLPLEARLVGQRCRARGFEAVVKIARALGTTCEAFAGCGDVGGTVSNSSKKPRARPRKGT